MSEAYCQACSRKHVMNSLIDPKPCLTCGCTNFDWSPKRHASEMALTDKDIEFLRINGIKPEKPNPWSDR